jgi:hypothetical protein
MAVGSIHHCSMDNTTILCCNVRGLHSGAHWALVADMAVQEKVSILCLLETKRMFIYSFLLLFISFVRSKY